MSKRKITVLAYVSFFTTVAIILLGVGYIIGLNLFPQLLNALRIFGLSAQFIFGGCLTAIGLGAGWIALAEKKYHWGEDGVYEPVSPAVGRIPYLIMGLIFGIGGIAVMAGSP